jgi:hypothetical protein
VIGFFKNQRVTTPLGPGRVVYQRMAPPSYSEPAAVSVRLDSKESEPRYAGTIFPAADVAPIPPRACEHPSLELMPEGGGAPVCNRCGARMEVR